MLDMVTLRRFDKSNDMLVASKLQESVTVKHYFTLVIYGLFYYNFAYSAIMDTTRPSLLICIKDLNNDQAWVEFDTIYRPLLHRFAEARGVNSVDVDDVIQHSMSAIHKYIKRFDYDPDKGRFRSWLRTIVNNHVRNLLKKKHAIVGESHDFDQIQSSEESPEDAFDRMWMEEHLKYCLRIIQSEVDERTFIAYQRYVINEQPVDQICESLNLSRDQLYKIKWTLTGKLHKKMHQLLDGNGSAS